MANGNNYDSGEYESSPDEQDTALTPAEEEAARLAEEEKKARIAIALAAAAQQQRQQLPTTLPTQEAAAQPGPGIPLVQQPYASSVPMPVSAPVQSPITAQPIVPPTLAPDQQAALQSRLAAATAPANTLPEAGQAARDRVAANDAATGSLTLPFHQRTRDPEELAAASAAQGRYEAQQKYRFLTNNGMPAAEAFSQTGVDMLGGQMGRRVMTPQTKTHFGPNGQVFQETGGVVKEVRPPNQGTRLPTDSILRGSIASERAQINALEKAQSKTTESSSEFANNSYLLNQHRTKLAELESKYEQAKQGVISAPETATGTTPAVVQKPQMTYIGKNVKDDVLAAQRNAIQAPAKERNTAAKAQAKSAIAKGANKAEVKKRYKELTGEDLE